MSVAVKICGLNDLAGIEAAVQAGADYIGFNFFPPSPRAVSPAEAAQLAAMIPARVKRVGLFVEPSEAEIAAALAAAALDILQLYTSAERIPALRARFGLPFWRAAGIASRADLPTTAGGADALLLDAKPAPDATRPGGNALRFDWSLIADWAAPSPWILAGGLTADNVAEAIRATGATIVDVSSGVESTPGRKDPALIRAFLAAAKG